MAPLAMSTVWNSRITAPLGHGRCGTTTRNIRSFALARPSALPIIPDQSQLRGEGGNREHLPLLSRVSACVEVNDMVTSYETFAGRSAMIGFATAFIAELVTDQGLFYSFTSKELAMFSSMALICISAAAGLAYLPTQFLGGKFKESVITSLTAVRRSASSVSQRRVDTAVDYLFEDAFGLGTLYTLLDEELL